MCAKRLLPIVVAMLAVAGQCVGQGITFAAGEKGNNKGYKPTELIVDKADADGVYYSVEPVLTATSKQKGLVVREVDFDYKELRKLPIANAENCHPVCVHRSGGKLHIVAEDVSKAQYTLRHISVNEQQFALDADSALTQVPLMKGGDYATWHATSPNGQYVGIVHATFGKNADNAKIVATLYNGNMQQLWSYEVPATAISQVIVTNRAEVAMVGCHLGDKKNEGALIEFNVVDANGHRQGREATVHRVGNMGLLNYQSGKVLAIALETDQGMGWAGSYAAGSVVTVGTVYEACAVYLYDIEHVRMLNTTRRQFTQDDARVFYNASVVQEVTKAEINFMSLRSIASTGYGGVALYGRSWTEKVTYGRSSFTDYTLYLKGMLAISADTLGNILWVRPIMHNNVGSSTVAAAHTETDMVAEGDRVYVFTNESADANPRYDPETAAPLVLMSPHGAIAAYGIDKAGNVQKQMVQTKGQNFIITPLRRQSAGHYTLISGRLRGKISEVTIPLAK